MAISLTKTIPKTSSLGGYSIAGGGSGTTACKITLVGIENITGNTKKSLIKIKIPQSKTTRVKSPSDKSINYIVDLKRMDDTIKIRGWLEDTDANDNSIEVDGSPETAATTAWEKYYALRAMCASGGSLTNLIIDNVEYKSTTQEAFLEAITFIAKSTDGSALNVTQGDHIARITVELDIYLGDER